MIFKIITTIVDITTMLIIVQNIRGIVYEYQRNPVYDTILKIILMILTVNIAATTLMPDEYLNFVSMALSLLISAVLSIIGISLTSIYRKERYEKHRQMMQNNAEFHARFKKTGKLTKDDFI